MAQTIFSFLQKCAIIMIFLFSMPFVDELILQKSGLWGILLLGVLVVCLFRILLISPFKRSKPRPNKVVFQTLNQKLSIQEGQRKTNISTQKRNPMQKQAKNLFSH